MNTPADKKVDIQEKSDDNTVTSFADIVNKTVSELKKDNKGNYIYPEDMSEELEFAVKTEVRHRHTQSQYTRTRQENKALTAEKSVLKKKATENVKVELTAEQVEELEDLKFSDPEAWRKKVNQYEADAQKKHNSELEEEVKKVSTASLADEEIERRATVLSEFLEANEGFHLDDDVIANDIPPRITRKLNEGKVTFEQFLDECLEYTQAGKTIKQEKVEGEPNLSKVGGRNSPDKNAVKEDAITSYRKEVY